jgi:membrane protease YdiL (CAAX protease family)
MEQEHIAESKSGDRIIAAWEIVSVVMSFLMAEWVVRPFGSHDKFTAVLPLALAIILMVLSHRARGETLKSIGWRLDNFWPAVRLLILPTLGVAILIIIAGFLTAGFGSDKWREWRWLLWLPVWALVQQYALQGFVNRRAQIVLGSGYRSILLVAMVFALLHLPNPWLTIATFIGGAIWATVYQRFPNLFATALSHAVMSLLFVWAIPTSLLRSLRVGLRYFL